MCLYVHANNVLLILPILHLYVEKHHQASVCLTVQEFKLTAVNSVECCSSS